MTSEKVDGGSFTRQIRRFAHHETPLPRTRSALSPGRSAGSLNFSRWPYWARGGVRLGLRFMPWLGTTARIEDEKSVARDVS